MSELKKEWYVVNTYAGHENKVKENLIRRVETMNLQDYLFQIVVAEEKEIEYKNGKEVEKVRNIFPGYLFVEMIMTDEAWYHVRNTPGVTGFIGSSGKGAKPFPLTPSEVDRILGSMGMSRLDAENDLKIDDKIKVIEGPFDGMFGTIKSIDLEHAKLEVALDLFGQETIVELELSQISKE